MIRVLQINAGENFGGVSAMVYNIYKFIDHNKIQFDFVSPNITSYYPYKTEIADAGGKIYELHADGTFLIRKLKFWFKLHRHIKKHMYQVIHINSGSVSFNFQVALIARICKVKKIIIHSHNAGNSNERIKILTPLMKTFITKLGTDFLSCSHKAAEYMFSEDIIREKKYKVILNGIETDKFGYDPKKRNDFRAKYGLNYKNVILHIGRFNIQKNHERLIEIFKAYHSINSNSVLLLVGEGELFDKINDKVKKLELSENVMFLGLRKDVPDILNAADIFLLPSLYEGLPVVGIEAQCSGISCVFSSEITREVDLSKHNEFVSLSEPDDVWAKKIAHLLSVNNDRYSEKTVIENKGYSIETTSRIMEHLYLS